METVVTGNGTEVKFGQGLPTVIIAERINPTGRKSLAAELQEGKLDIVRTDAKKQTEAGGHIIDINVDRYSANIPFNYVVVELAVETKNKAHSRELSTEIQKEYQVY